MTMQTAYSMEMGPYYLYRQKNMKGNFENVGYAKVDKAGHLQYTDYGRKTAHHRSWSRRFFQAGV